MTIGAYADSWLRDTAGTVKPSTLDFYRAALLHFDAIESVPVSALSPAHVRDLIARRTAEGYASRTIRGVVQTLSLVLRRAMEDGLTERNVAALVKLPRLVQKEPAHFTVEQARRFLEVAKDDELGSLYAVALGTGLRRGELLALQRSDVDVRAGTVRVRSGKTASAARVVPLPAFAQAALAARLDGGRRGGVSVLQRGPIWPVRPEVVSRRFKELCIKAGVPVLTMHSTRHTAASLLLDAGVDPLVIQQIIGHTALSMTAHYARSGAAVQREAMDRLGRALG